MRSPAELSLDHAPVDGANPTPLDGVVIYRRSTPCAGESVVYAPGIFLVTQGRKEAEVGDEVFVYDPDHYLVTAVPIPVRSSIVDARPDRPMLSVVLDLDLDDVRAIATLTGGEVSPAPPQRGLAACPVTPAIRDVLGRLLALLDEPRSAAVLGPLYRRELLTRVLEGPHGGLLRAVSMGSGPQRAIADVLTRLHADVARPFRVVDLAATAGMSESTFYEAFRAVTAETPLQYAKRLRLQEAHRRLTAGQVNVSEAAYGVGYQSLSQFSREFTRQFGAPPSACLPR